MNQEDVKDEVNMIQPGEFVMRIPECCKQDEPCRHVCKPEKKPKKNRWM